MSSSSIRLVDDRASRGRVRIGCSGWHYKSWRATVYPATLPTSQWLRAYAERFDTVELNNTFYRLPPEETFAEWRAQVPRTFVFAIKASRFLTHIKRLREPNEPLTRLFDRLAPLGPTMGPVLYQLPPRWMPDTERLEGFLEALPRRLGRRRIDHVIEMRDPRGYEPAVLERLRAHGVSVCLHDMVESAAPHEIVSPVLYVRFHGYGAKYAGSYPAEVLESWAAIIVRALQHGRDAYAFFNNDLGGTAVRDAERLRDIVRRVLDMPRSARDGRRLA